MTTSETRTLVLLRRDIAPRNWHRPFDELVAKAESGSNGFAVREQGKTGKHERYWDLGINIPEDWGAYYKGNNGRAQLHIQNYSERPKAWMVYAEVKKSA